VLNSPNRRFHLLYQLAVGLLIGAAFGLIVVFVIPGSDADNRSEVQGVDSEVEAPTLDLPAIPVVGERAPDFVLGDTSGRLFALEDFQGQVVLVNFWATWCAPCRLEMPLLQDHFERYSDDEFIVLAINLQESKAQVADFIEEFSLTFPVLMDSDGAISEDYRIRGYPSTIVIDRQGVISAIHIGIITEGQLEEYLSEVGLSL
jgi:peroxiredoxin